MTAEAVQSGSDSSIQFEPINELNMFQVRSNLTGIAAQRELASAMRQHGWMTSLKSEMFKTHSISEVVRLISDTPITDKETNLIHPLLRHQLCPLMWSVEKPTRLIIAVRLNDNSGFARSADHIQGALVDNLSFAFNPRQVSDCIRLVILNDEDFDQLARSELLTSPEARRQFTHQFSNTAVGAEVRDTILAEAVKARASDIHIEPKATDKGVKFTVRYRIDGVLRDAEHELGIEQGMSLITSIKNKGRMDIADRLRPGDGQIEFDEEDFERYSYLRGHNCRISTVPTKIGESCCIRILKTPRIEALSLDRIGFSKAILQHSKDLLDTPSGIILMTGPTGSGKTTTLYALLQSLNDGTRKIYTIEQPVEITMPGLTQTEVNEGVGTDFKTLLRAALRQDPDVILIGEIRDEETAQTAVSASTTGHLVFATLHTKSAIATIPRLREFGLEPSRIVDNLRGVYAQRLVRSCCPNCTERYDGRDELNALLKLPETHQLHGKIELVRPIKNPDKDCGDCAGTGYVGRTVVTELWRMTAAERDMINSGIYSEQRLMALSMEKQRFVPLAIRGLQLALEQKTSIAEILGNVVNREDLREVAGHARYFINKRLNLPS